MHRYTSKQGINLIKQFEGFRPKPYVCIGGFQTIGYGHKLLPHEKYPYIDETEAELILTADLNKAERAVLKYINVLLSDNQFTALVSFTYNVGIAALQRSTLRQKLNYGDYLTAGEEFLKWIYASGRQISGLVIRRKIESALFLHKI